MVKTIKIKGQDINVSDDTYALYMQQENLINAISKLSRIK